jgi:hypothetical protein
MHMHMQCFYHTIGSTEMCLRHFGLAGPDKPKTC